MGFMWEPCLVFCRGLLTGVLTSALVPCSLCLSHQPEWSFKPQVKSCHSSAPDPPRVFHLRVKAQGIPIIYNALSVLSPLLCILYLISNLPLVFSAYVALASVQLLLEVKNARASKFLQFALPSARRAIPKDIFVFNSLTVISSLLKSLSWLSYLIPLTSHILVPLLCFISFSFTI